MKFRDLIEMIEHDGWTLVRTKGSHRQFKHPLKAGTVTVAGKPNLDVPPGTLSSIFKQAGLKEGKHNEVRSGCGKEWKRLWRRRT